MKDATITSETNQYALKFCSSIENVTIDESVTAVPSGMFSNCINLKTVILGDNISRIYGYAFYNCTALENVRFGNNVQYIYESAFENCTKLKFINLSTDIKQISNYAFKNCALLEKIYIPSTCTSIGTSVVEGCSNIKVYTNIEYVKNNMHVTWLKGANYVCFDMSLADYEKYSNEHTHVYGTEKEYCVEDGNVYHAYRCPCGNINVSDKVLVENTIIVTPENVQDIVDGNINDKTIVFSSGYYYSKIKLRPTTATATAYATASSGIGAQVSISALTTSDAYHYFRTIQNVTFVGEKNAIIGAGILVNNQYFNKGTPIGGDNGEYSDVIRDNKSYMSFYNHTTLNNITFEGLNFRSVSAIIEMYSYHNFTGYDSINKATISNITIKDCNYYVNGETSGKASARFYTKNSGIFSNITYNNNTVYGYQKALETISTTNVTIRNNTVENIRHNAFSIFGEGNDYSGTIIIDGNTITNGADRAIKLDDGHNASITITNNVITNASDSDGEVIQIKKLSETTGGNNSVLISGNTINGNACAEMDSDITGVYEIVYDTNGYKTVTE